ncbi:Protein-L-isoaspartate O-methyltransferase [hydrothermal vent metagenome]|uniref:protein-L-isoaspartate(D-aspartate) O-methyltransferase n=1 Tax=hydrothermal vent metagenome TaxID=652676 RepID=A0A3B0ZQR8_9ZZZZ
MSAVNIQGIGMTSQRTRNRLIERLRTKGIKDENVLEVMRNTPRHIFMDEALASRAYEDTALPIGSGQTISQPYIVARMTEVLLAGEKRLGKVLEIGTGSAYQTAILAQLAEQVFSIERIQHFIPRAKKILAMLELRNVNLKHYDGYKGWASFAPYDAIIVTAAPDEVPLELLHQLVDGARLVIPSGEQGRQQLLCITREGDDFIKQNLDMVSFVPLVKGTRL